MPLMQYKAMDERGRIATGRMEAANAADLELRLERMGLDLVNFAEAKIRASASSGTRVPRRELIGFCFQLEQLLSSGVPVIDGLVDLRDSVEDRNLREVIAGMIESIEGGKTLSGAMEEFPQVFDGVFINLVRAGEFSGQVGAVLQKITETLKWQDEQAAQVKKLLMYPTFVGLVVILVLAFLMTYLVPQLVGFIKNMGQELPWHTKVLIGISNVFVNYWWAIVISPVVIGLAVMLFYKASPGFQYAVDDFKLRVWVMGPILKKIILARFANYFALMYASGITVLDCVRISEGLVGNKAVEEATRRAGRQIADGASISAGFESTGLFPPLVLRMLRVGESTGALDTALLNISYFYNRDVNESMQRLQAMIGPVMTVVLGGVLGWVILSVLGPIYDLISQIDF
ncbi:MAG TPA: type II secretion system F family protein [Gammaproteobacteria bacterium]|nr:type II secretion system F family protein [Gammaproteobacteria bacterium]